MGFWDSNSSTYLPNRRHGQLTIAPVFPHVSLLVLIFHFTSLPLNLIAASVVFTRLFIGHPSQVNSSAHACTVLHDCSLYRGVNV